MNAWDIPLSRRLFAFAIVALSYVFYAYAWQTVDTLKPFFMEKWGLTRTEVSFFYGTQSVGAMLGAVGAAWAADRFGRVRVLALITAGYAVAMLAMPYCPGFLPQLADHFVLGLFVGGVFGTAAGIYVGLFPPRHRGKAASVLALMFWLAVGVQGFIGRLVLDVDWTLMVVWGGAPALLAAVLLLVFVPDDRHVVPYPSPAHPEHAKSSSGVRLLFAPAYRTTTLKLIALSAINFAASEAFGGWVTAYLKEHGSAGSMLGAVVALQGLGGVVGVIGWGLVADRFGRRANAAGFVAAAAMVVVFLLTATKGPAYAMVSMFAFSMMMNSTMIWGPLFAELYPIEVRSTAASVFHYGRIISFLAPTLVAEAADRFGLGPAMSSSAVLYALGAIIWWTLPETLDRTRPTDGRLAPATCP